MKINSIQQYNYTNSYNKNINKSNNPTFQASENMENAQACAAATIAVLWLGVIFFNILKGCADSARKFDEKHTNKIENTDKQNNAQQNDTTAGATFTKENFLDFSDINNTTAAISQKLDSLNIMTKNIETPQMQAKKIELAAKEDSINKELQSVSELQEKLKFKKDSLIKEKMSYQTTQVSTPIQTQSLQYIKPTTQKEAPKAVKKAPTKKNSTQESKKNEQKQSPNLGWLPAVLRLLTRH